MIGNPFAREVRSWLSRMGGRMMPEKTVELGRDPTADMEAATKQYVDAAVAGAGGEDTWGDQDFFPQSYWGRRHVQGSNSTSVVGEGVLSTASAVAVTAPGGASRVADSEGCWIQCATGTGASPVEAGAPAFSPTLGAAQRALLPVYRCRIRLGQVAGAWNAWFGLSNATGGINSPQAGVNPNTLHCAGFRFFPSLGGTPDTSWWVVSGDATNGQSTDTGLSVVADTTYELLVDMSVSGSIRYYINGVLYRTETSVLPGNTIDLGIVNIIRRTGGTANRTMQWLGDTMRYTINL